MVFNVMIKHYCSNIHMVTQVTKFIIQTIAYSSNKDEIKTIISRLRNYELKHFLGCSCEKKTQSII